MPFDPPKWLCPERSPTGHLGDTQRYPHTAAERVGKSSIDNLRVEGCFGCVCRREYLQFLRC